MKKSLLLASALLVSAVAGNAAEKRSEAARNFKVTPVETQAFKAELAMPTQKLAKASAAERIAKAPQKAASDVQAFYRRPRGCFFRGMSEAGYASPIPSLIVPPFRTVTWTDESVNNTARSWELSAYDYESGDYATYTTEDASFGIEYGFEVPDAPTLTATNGANSSTYAIYGTYSGTQYNASLFSVADYNEQANSYRDTQGDWYWAASSFQSSPRNPLSNNATSSTAAFGVYGGEDWECWFGKNAKGLCTMGAAYEKPEVPYVIKKIGVFGVGHATEDVELTVKVYKIATPATDETDIVLGDVIATGKATFAANDEVGLQFLTFNLTEDVDGLSLDVTPEISDDIFVSLEGYDVDGFEQFWVPFGNENIDEGYLHAGYLGGYTEDGSLVYASMHNFFSGINVYSAPAIMLDIEKPFIVYNYTNETGNWEAPVEGGSKELSLFSYKPSDEMSFTTEEGDELPEWLTYECADSEEYADGMGGETTVTFTAAALPADVQGRVAHVVVSYPGAKATYTVTQGTTGISTVATSAAKVAVVNGDFVVNAPEAINNVTVYNVAGQAVKTAAVEGETTISAKNLAKGVYVLKFNDGSKAKVVK